MLHLFPKIIFLSVFFSLYHFDWVMPAFLISAKKPTLLCQQSEVIADLTENASLAALQKMSKQTSLSSFFNKPKRSKLEDTDVDNDNAVIIVNKLSSSTSATPDATSSTLPTTPASQPSSPPADLSALLEPATQPDLKEFPRTVINGKARSFSAKWYKEFRFLEYSISKDAVFCKACRHFPPEMQDRGLALNGYRDWKHLRQACERHNACKYHLNAVEKLRGFRISQTSGSVVSQMNRDMDSLVNKNREHIKVVLDVLLFCAKQNIPLRGHRETDEAVNRGNVIELFKFVSQFDPQIEQRLAQIPKNATMLSPEVQNDLLEAAATLLLRNIKSEINNNSAFYAIIADEYKDQAKRELLAVCIRYIHNGIITERAVGFVAIEDMSATAISRKILEVIEPLQLDPSLCVGFSFDGAAVMSGNKGGVQAILKETFPRAVYIHCNSHRLNLVLATVSKSSVHVSTFFETLNSLHSFMTGSSRHARFLEMQKELNPTRQSLELERSTDVRWSSKSGSVKKVLTLLDAVLEVLSEYGDSANSQTRLEAQSLAHQIETKKFIFLLVTFAKLFDITDFATKGLQSPTLSIVDCIDLIESVKESFIGLRDHSQPQNEFGKVLSLTDDLTKKHEITLWDVTTGRARRVPARISESIVMSAIGNRQAVRNDEDLKLLWDEILDRQLAELASRFQDDQYGIMKAAAACRPPTGTFEKALLHPPCQHYGIVIGDAELSVFAQQIKRKVTAGITFPSLMEVLDSCPQDIFPGVNALLRVILTLATTSCTAERIFSTTGRIHTRLRSSMGTSRLCHLTLLCHERELTERLDPDEILKIFCEKPRRLRFV